MHWLLLGAGLVLVIEGLVLALLPNRLEEILEALNKIPHETRRLIGLTAITIGVDSRLSRTADRVVRAPESRITKNVSHVHTPLSDCDGRLRCAGSLLSRNSVSG